MAPVYAQMAAQLENVVFVKVRKTHSSCELSSFTVQDVERDHTFIKTLCCPRAEVVLIPQVDVDQNPRTKDACGITSMPTYQFYKSGAKVAQFSGANEAKLRSTIDEFK